MASCPQTACHICLHLQSSASRQVVGLGCLSVRHPISQSRQRRSRVLWTWRCAWGGASELRKRIALSYSQHGQHSKSEVVQHIIASSRESRRRPRDPDTAAVHT